jgi:hypothetical protein
LPSAAKCIIFLPPEKAKALGHINKSHIKHYPNV